VRKGPVSSRVALLLRSAEGKPFFASISQYIRVTPLAHAMQGMTTPTRRALAACSGLYFAPLGVLPYQRAPTPAEGVPWALPGQARRGMAARRGGGRSAAGRRMRYLEQALRPRSACLPWRTAVLGAIGLPALEKRGHLGPSSRWSACLPWRRGLACPGGEGLSPTARSDGWLAGWLACPGEEEGWWWPCPMVALPALEEGSCLPRRKGAHHHDGQASRWLACLACLPWRGEGWW
jgi:hypothetical protein